MESKNYSIIEVELDPKEAKQIITELINTQIQTYRLKSWQDWEKDHYNESKWKAEIEKLMHIKTHLDSEFEKIQENTDLLNINFSLGLEKVI